MQITSINFTVNGHSLEITSNRTHGTVNRSTSLHHTTITSKIDGVPVVNKIDPDSDSIEQSCWDVANRILIRLHGTRRRDDSAANVCNSEIYDFGRTIGQLV